MTTDVACHNVKIWANIVIIYINISLTLTNTKIGIIYSNIGITSVTTLWTDAKYWRQLRPKGLQDLPPTKP
jgi:hypothetical protein